jgi:hypothetical protein
MTKYDLYDIYAVIVYIRAYPNDTKNAEIAKAVKSLLDEPKGDYGSLNEVRHAIAAIDGVDRERWHWAFVENDYTYIPGFIKNELPYRVLSEGFAEIIYAIESGDSERIYRAADAMHNVPIIFAENDIKEAKKQIKREISFYRKEYNSEFLKYEI